MAISFGKQNSKYKQYGYPNLLLDFAKTKSLIESINKNTPITFTRASSVATYVGADGLIKRAATNLVLYSEQFDNAAWSKASGVTVSANQTIAPDGKQTADLISVPAGSGGVYQSISGTVSGQAYTWSVYVKGVPGEIVNVGTNPASGGSPVYKQVSLTDDWQRVSGTIVSNGSNINFHFRSDYPSPSGVVGAFDVYAWGAQLEEGTIATPYIKTTSTVSGAPRFDHDPLTGESLGLLVEEQRANATTDSEIENGYASKTAGGLLTDTGFTGLFKNSGVHFGYDGATLSYLYSSGAIVGQPLVVSFFVRMDDGGAPAIGYGSSNDFLVVVGGYALSTPAVNIENYGNGLYRVWAYRPSAAGQNNGAQKQSSNSSRTFTISGFQIENNVTFPTSYIPTEGSAVTRTPDIAAIQDADFSYTNLLSYSESFDVGWTLSDATVIANQTTAPDGQTTADRIEWSGSSSKRVFRTGLSSTLGVVSVYAKADQETTFSIWTNGASRGTIFDLAAGTATPYPGLGSTWSSIKPVGNGWYLCSHFYNAATTDVYFYARNGTTFTPTNPTDGIYLWGAQFTATEYPVDYVSTRNLLTDSQDFERSTWLTDSGGGGTGAVVTNNYGQAPDGTFTADRVQLNKTGGTFSRIQQLLGVASGIYTFSVWMKTTNGGTSNVGIRIYDTGINATVTGEWNRFSVSLATPGTNAASQILLFDSIVGNDETADILVWGAQTEPGSTATEYLRTTDVVGKKYPWFEITEGTFSLSYNPDFIDTTGRKYLVFLWDTGNNRFSIRSSDITSITYPIAAIGTGTTVLGLNGSSVTAKTDQNLCLAYGSTQSLAQNGLLEDTNSTQTQIIPALNAIHILGYNGGQIQNGHIKHLLYWNRRLADSALQGLTSGSFE